MILSCGKSMITDVFGTLSPEIVTASFATAFVSGLSAANLGGRMGWGAFSDVMTSRRTMMLFWTFGWSCMLYVVVVLFELRAGRKKSPQNLKNKTPGTIPYFAHSAVSAGSSVRSVLEHVLEKKIKYAFLKQPTTTLYFGKALEDNENSFESQYSFYSSVDFQAMLNK